MTTPEFHYLLGKAIHGIERSLGVKQPSLLATAYKHAVPICVGAVQDGSHLPQRGEAEAAAGPRVQVRAGHQRRRLLDGGDAALLPAPRRARSWRSGSSAAACPRTTRCRASRCSTRSSPCPPPGFDIDLQFCVDPVDNGALSSCPAGEGHTWGKVSVEAVETGSVYVHTDVTAVFPWLTHALFSAGAKRDADAADGPDGRRHRLPRPGRRPAEEEAAWPPSTGARTPRRRRRASTRWWCAEPTESRVGSCPEPSSPVAPGTIPLNQRLFER